MRPELAGSVAIVGMAAVFPGASSLDELWGNILHGVDATGPVPADRIDPVYFDRAAPGVDRFACRRGGFVDTQPVLDPVALGVMPATVDYTEPDQLLSLALAARAVADAGGEALAAYRDHTGVIVGRGGYLTPGLARLDQRVRVAEQLVHALRSMFDGLTDAELAAMKSAFVEELGGDRPDAAIDLVPNLAASRVANRLDLHGPAYTVDAACASALVAVDQGMAELRSRRCDVVLAGAVHLCHDVTLWSVFTQLGALSRNEEVRPFDRRADGMLIGEGGGMLVLRRTEDAERDGTRIYAVVTGTGVASDGRSASLMRPSVDGQVKCLERAWQMAGTDPASLGLVEGHGTATPAGDAAELETLHRFFGAHVRDRRVGLGSVKSMIGHAMPAAGAAALIKAALAVHHGILPPTIHCEEAHDALSGSPFVLQREAEPWDEGGRPRVAGVDAFGFGGINAHVVLESPDASSRSRRSRPMVQGRPLPGAHVRPLPGAQDRPGDRDRTGALASLEPILLIEAPTPSDLALGLERAAANEAALDRHAHVDEAASTTRPGPARLALVNPTAERLALASKVVERGRAWRGRSDLWFSPHGLACQGGRVGFLFPGVEPSFEPRLDDVAAYFGLSMPALVGSDAARSDLEGLGRSLVAAGRLLHAVAVEVGLRPDVVAGQSIGEWSGMIATDMIPAAEVDGFIQSIRPGSLNVPGVEFVALGTSIDVVGGLVEGLDGLEISHDNCPHQTIVCGPSTLIASLVDRARRAKVIVQELPFRSGFHTSMFAGYLEPFREALDRLPLQRPVVPLWSATTCAPYPEEATAVRHLALSHLVERVRFRELTLALRDSGVRLFVQVGVGSLPGLVEDTLSGDDVLAISLNVPRRSGMAQLRRSVAACWVEGIDDLALDRLEMRPVGADVYGMVGMRAGAFGPTPGSANATPGSAGTPAAPPPMPVAVPERSRLRTLPVATPLVTPRALEWLGSSAAGSSGGLVTRRPPGVPSFGGGSPGAVERELVALQEEITASGVAVAAALVSSPSRRAEPVAPPGGSAGAIARTLVLSTGELPELGDHCFYRQPPDWPIMADRFPVVPMTAIIEMIMATAKEVLAGWVPVEVRDVRALRWLTVEPPTTVTIRGVEQPSGDDRRRVRVTLEGYARATVVMARTFPTAPAPHMPELADGKPSLVAAERLYEDRWMFHGPAYQGVSEIRCMSEAGIDGVLRAGRAPGMLLDNAGQLMGLWVMLWHEQDRLALPTSIDQVELFGPTPHHGEKLRAAVRVTGTDDSAVRADMELVSDGQVWCRIRGWEDRRFDSDDVVWPVLIWPEHNGLAEPGAGGWLLAEEHWRSSASRELMMRRYLSQDEQVRYASLHPRAQRLYLLGRIAAKDAARRWLWDRGAGPIWPLEVTVSNDPSGRPIIHAPGDARLSVSISHTPWLGVALVDEDRPVGIDAERVEERPAQFATTAFSDDELRLLLEGIDAATHPRLLTTGWAVKEALAKSRGDGLGGRPKDISITECSGGSFVVDGRLVTTALRDGVVIAWTNGSWR